MGWISSLLSGVAGLGAIGYQISKDQHLTGSQREANAFSAAEAEKSRSFEAQQAEIARDWQEQQYLMYNSPEAMVRQYQDAGLNPALMYGNGSSGAAASMASPMPGSSSAASVSPTGAGDLTQMVANMALLKSQIDNVRADTRQKNAGAAIEEIRAQTEPALRVLEIKLKEQGVDLNDIDLAWKSDQYEQAYRKGELDVEMARVGIAKALTEIQQLQADIVLTTRRGDTELLIQALTSAQEALANANENYVSAQAANEWWFYNFRKRTGFTPGTNVWNLLPEVVDLSSRVYGKGVQFLRDIGSALKGKVSGAVEKFDFSTLPVPGFWK